MVFGDERVELLDNGRVQIVENLDKKVMDNVKISKQFKLVNPVPRF